MTNERPEWLDTMTSPWFIVGAFVLGYAYAAYLRLRRCMTP